MRRSTQVVILALATMACVLVAYYLLPLWWARLVNGWVGAGGSWLTGLLLGLVSVALGSGAFLGAWRLSTTGQDEGRRGIHAVRLALTFIAGLCLAAALLTISIAIGFTEPLRQARQIWHTHAPSLLWATLVGSLTAIIGILVITLIRSRLRARHTAPEVDDEPTTTPPPDPSGDDGAQE